MRIDIKKKIPSSLGNNEILINIYHLFLHVKVKCPICIWFNKVAWKFVSVFTCSLKNKLNVFSCYIISKSTWIIFENSLKIFKLEVTKKLKNVHKLVVLDHFSFFNYVSTSSLRLELHHVFVTFEFNTFL